jgi:DNA (cytosine-5)-methyltransferase 1
MNVYYNEHDAFAAAWLRELIGAGLLPAGDVDERDVQLVQPADIAGYEQCHFFAGIGGWPYALQLAGWGDRPVWTGSCPCQPFSSAGKGAGFDDPRHLWPAWFRLIRECRPAVVFGEQVASPPGLRWLDSVSTDLEAEGYAFGACDLAAASVGAPHIRQRLFFVADAGSSKRWPLGGSLDAERNRDDERRPQACCDAGARGALRVVADGSVAGRRAQPERPAGEDGRPAEEPRRLRDAGGLVLADGAGSQGRPGHAEGEGPAVAIPGAACGLADSGSGRRPRIEPALAGISGAAQVLGPAQTARASRCGDARGLADDDGERLAGRPEPDLGPQQPGEQTPRRRDALRRGPVALAGSLADATCCSDADQRFGDGSSGLHVGDEPRAGGRDGSGDHASRGGEALAGDAGASRVQPWSEVRWIPCLDGKLRPAPTEPGIQSLVDGLSAGVVCLWDASQGEVEAKVRSYAAAAEIEPGEALLNLWREASARAVRERTARGSHGVLAAALLLAVLRKLAVAWGAIAEGVPQQGAETPEELLRGVRVHAESARASRQRRLDGQQAGEPADVVRELSQVLARHTRSAGPEAVTSDAVFGFPLVSGVPGRARLLRGSGNAIVPEVAAEFVAAFLEVTA